MTNAKENPVIPRADIVHVDTAAEAEHIRRTALGPEHPDYLPPVSEDGDVEAEEVFQSLFMEEAGDGNEPAFQSEMEVIELEKLKKRESAAAKKSKPPPAKKQKKSVVPPAEEKKDDDDDDDDDIDDDADDDSDDAAEDRTELTQIIIDSIVSRAKSKRQVKNQQKQCPI